MPDRGPVRTARRPARPAGRAGPSIETSLNDGDSPVDIGRVARFRDEFGKRQGVESAGQRRGGKGEQRLNWRLRSAGDRVENRFQYPSEGLAGQLLDARRSGVGLRDVDSPPREQYEGNSDGTAVVRTTTPP